MRIVILGAGVVGVTTAYVLASRGHSVSVVDRGGLGATETSFANGGQLSYSHAEPWATPGVLKYLPGWLIRPDSPLVIRRLDPDIVRWGLKFLRNCTPARAHAHSIAMLRLGLYSRQKMQDFWKVVGHASDYLNHGILHIFEHEKEWRAAIAQVEFQAKFGADEKILSAEECLRVEPVLAQRTGKIVGGVFDHMDETGDAYLFTQAMIERCKELGVAFHFGVTIESLQTEAGRIQHVSTLQGDIEADIYVMALGSYSPIYLKPLNIHIPVYPMKGYSLTIPANEHTPKLSVTDVSKKVVYTPLGKRLRVAGTAEFAGYNSALNEKRLGPILRDAKKMLPMADWDQPVERWACLRASTPDGPPILGPTPYANLFLNTGHGTLGWTQSAGSANLVADMIEGRVPEIMLQGLTLERYLT